MRTSTIFLSGLMLATVLYSGNAFAKITGGEIGDPSGMSGTSSTGTKEAYNTNSDTDHASIAADNSANPAPHPNNSGPMAVTPGTNPAHAAYLRPNTMGSNNSSYPVH